MGPCTKKLAKNSATLYLHVFDWPKDGKLVVPGSKNAIVSAALAASETRLNTSRSANDMVITVPALAPDNISSTVILKIKGALEITDQP